VVAALLIIGTAAVVVVGGLTEAIRAQHRVRRHVEAVALADAKLGELAALPDDSLPRATRAGRFGAPFSGYRWRTAVWRAAVASPLVEATVAVEWDGGSYALATTLYRRSLPEAIGAEGW
jgi:hypothetical protein